LSKVFSFTLLFILIITPAFAQDRDRPIAGKFSLSPEGGTSFTVGGEFVNQMMFQDSTTIGSTTITASISNESFDFDDAFETPEIFGISLGFGISDATELFTRINHVRANAERFAIARFDVSGTFGSTTVSAGETLDGQFDDYKEWSFTMGARHYINRLGRFSPFVSIEGGVGHVEQIDLELFDSVSNLPNISFYDDSWTPKVGIGAGISYNVNDNISLSVESGVGYEAALNADDDSWGYAYKDVNNAGERWSVPITFGFKVRW